jgi:hypothetical protein
VHQSHVHLVAHRYHYSRLYLEFKQVSPSSQSTYNVPSFYCVLKAFDDVILHVHLGLHALCTFPSSRIVINHIK